MNNSLRQHAEDYLTMRRSLGFKLTVFEELLFSFIAYMEDQQATVITTDLAVAWARITPRSTREARWSRRLSVVRIFARHLQVFDQDTEIPAADILATGYCRVTPHLYNMAQINQLLAATTHLKPQLRRYTWETLIALLSVTGLRAGEACRLDDHDVDLTNGILLVRDSKFAKSRDVPLHESSVTALGDYAKVRDQLRVNTVSPAFFISGRGTRLNNCNLDQTFVALREHAGLHASGSDRPPRLHDFRHSFATATMTGWYRAGQDVQACLPLLSTYLGHADPKSTYWYLTGAPELLELATERITGLMGGPADE